MKTAKIIGNFIIQVQNTSTSKALHKNYGTSSIEPFPTFPSIYIPTAIPKSLIFIALTSCHYQSSSHSVDGKADPEGNKRTNKSRKELGLSI